MIGLPVMKPKPLFVSMKIIVEFFLVYEKELDVDANQSEVDLSLSTENVVEQKF